MSVRPGIDGIRLTNKMTHQWIEPRLPYSQFYTLSTEHVFCCFFFKLEAFYTAWIAFRYAKGSVG